MAADKPGTEPIAPTDDQQELVAARQRIESLTFTLHDVQARLERKHYALLNSRASGRVLSPSGNQAATDRSRIHLLAVNDTPPHLHLEFHATPYVFRGRVLPALRWRLLNHFGHTGLAVFRGNTTLPVAGWYGSGSENGEEFMTLMPSDPESRLRLRALSTSDWALVNDLVVVSCEAIEKDDWHIARSWLAVGRRLRAELGTLVDGLRFDTHLVHAGEHPIEPVTVRLTDVEYGGRQLGDVTLELHSSGSLRWLLPDGAATVPLSNWPSTPSGDLSQVMTLSPGRRTSWLAWLNFSRQIHPSERDMVAMILTAASQRVRASELSIGRTAQARTRLIGMSAMMMRMAKLLIAHARIAPCIRWFRPS